MLVQQKKHGGLIQELIEAGGASCAFIFGENNQDERKEALRDLGNGKLDVLIGSTILDVGVDVPALGAVINGGGGKAEVGFRQRIGRGLREKKTGDNNCFFMDFQDQGNRILKSHADTRLEIVASTPGFAEGILMSDQDFPYGGVA